MSNALAQYKKTLSELSEDELKRLMLETRSNRRVVKKQTIERAEKAQKNGLNTKAAMRQTLKGLTAEQAAELLAKLTGG